MRTPRSAIRGSRSPGVILVSIALKIVKREIDQVESTPCVVKEETKLSVSIRGSVILLPFGSVQMGK